MKNLQVKLSDNVHNTMQEVATKRGLTVSDLVRQALELYMICAAYAAQGRRLTWEDPRTGDKAEVVIPGFNWLGKVKDIFETVVNESVKRVPGRKMQKSL